MSRNWERRGNKEKPTLVVQQLFSRLGSVLGVGALDNGVDGARLLAEAAVDALGHVDIVAGGSSGAVGSLLGLDGDGLGGADLRRVSMGGPPRVVGIGTAREVVQLRRACRQCSALHPRGIVGGRARLGIGGRWDPGISISPPVGPSGSSPRAMSRIPSRRGSKWCSYSLVSTSSQISRRSWFVWQHTVVGKTARAGGTFPSPSRS